MQKCDSFWHESHQREHFGKRLPSETEEGHLQTSPERPTVCSKVAVLVFIIAGTPFVPSKKHMRISKTTYHIRCMCKKSLFFMDL